MPSEFDSDLTNSGGVQTLRRIAYLTAATGIAHAVLLVVAFFVIRHHGVPVNASDAELIEFIEDDDRRRWVTIAGIYLIPFAGIAFIWFTVSMRSWLSISTTRLAPLLANILLVCGVIYVVLVFAAGSAMSVISLVVDSEDVLGDVDAYRQFPQYGSALLLVFAMRMAAMIVFATSSIGRKSKVLPSWFAVSGYALGVLLLLTSSLDPIVVLIFPAWLTVLCVMLLIRAHGASDLRMEEAGEALQRAQGISVGEATHQ